MTPHAPVRWGFLGAGFVASRGLAPAVHDATGAVLQVVAAREATRAALLEPVRAVDSYAAVCEADDVDVVYLSLPNDDHLPWVLTALGAGKHVLCEKPLGLDAAQVVDMMDAAQRAGTVLVEASWNRWHPRTRRVEALLGSVDGQIDGMPGSPSRASPPATTGSTLIAVAVHSSTSAATRLQPR